MAIWIFMFILCLPTPIIMIAFGRYFGRSPSHDINSVIGYRTARSTKNKDTWAFAHAYFGVISRRLGWILLILSVAVMLAVFGRDETMVGKIGSLVLIGQVVALIVSIFPTEAALKRTFNEKGQRRNRVDDEFYR